LSRLCRTLVVGALAMLVASLSACAVNPGAGGSTPPSAANNQASVPDVAPVPAIAAQVPEATRAGGVLQVGTSAMLPPMSFVGDDNTTLVGFDIDMAKAVAATMGLRAQITNAGFDTLVPGLQAGRFALAMSSMGVTAERQRVVDFVDYYNGGQGFLAAKTTDFAIADLPDLCGKRVAVTTGSTQQSTLQDSQHICADADRAPYELQAFPDNNSAVLAIRGNRVDVLYSSISIVGYTAAQNPDFRIAGRYKRAMVGAAVAKSSPLTPVVQQAIQHLMDDGTYKQLLDKWGLSDNAAQTAKINSAGTS
jgi:polar amino acid transport system substrate-binding protein